MVYSLQFRLSLVQMMCKLKSSLVCLTYKVLSDGSKRGGFFILTQLQLPELRSQCLSKVYNLIYSFVMSPVGRISLRCVRHLAVG